MNPADEIVAIVDDQNRVVGSAPRRDMRQNRLPHRSTYILVFNSHGDLCVQKRTTTKDVFPGYYDIAAGGVVLAGETYEAGARRELAEEVGIRDVPLAHHFVFHYADDDTPGCGAACSRACMTGNWSCRKKKWKAPPSCRWRTSCRTPSTPPTRRTACTCCGAIWIQRIRKDNRPEATIARLTY